MGLKRLNIIIEELTRDNERLTTEGGRLKEQAAIDKDFIQQYQLEVSKIMELLKDANRALRSATEIAQRDGKSTNWDAFRSRLAKVLLPQHKYLYPDGQKDD